MVDGGRQPETWSPFLIAPSIASLYQRVSHRSASLSSGNYCSTEVDKPGAILHINILERKVVLLTILAFQEQIIGHSALND